MRQYLRSLVLSTALLWTLCACCQPLVLVLVVEGVNPYRLLAPVLGKGMGPVSDLESGYLLRSPLVQSIGRQTGAELRLLPWSGVPNDQAGLRAAVTDLKRELLAARGGGLTVCLVTHSLGSVIAHLALAELAGMTPPVAALVSLASPLGRPPILLWLAQAHPGLPVVELATRPRTAETLGTRRWINVYTPWDPLGGPIDVEGVDNRPLALLPSGPLPGLADLVRAHTLPFRDPAFTARLAEELAGVCGSPAP